MVVIGATYKAYKNKKTGKISKPVLVTTIKAARRVPRGRSGLALAVKNVLNRELETKFKNQYSGAVFPSIGAYPATNEGHNASISAVADIHRMIPDVPQSAGQDTAFTRNGNKLTVKNLSVQLAFSIKDDAIEPSPRALNLMVCVYIWQHKQYKTYNELGVRNNFGAFLDRGNGNTGGFSGLPCDGALPLAKDNYKLCKKLMFPLRTDGSANGQVVGANFVVSNTNSSAFQRTFNLNLTKYIPKTLQYPIQPQSPINPQFDSYPTNSSLCMSVGWYNMDFSSPSDLLAEPLLNVQYVTKFTFKDA